MTTLVIVCHKNCRKWHPCISFMRQGVFFETAIRTFWSNYFLYAYDVNQACILTCYLERSHPFNLFLCFIQKDIPLVYIPETRIRSYPFHLRTERGKQIASSFHGSIHTLTKALHTGNQSSQEIKNCRSCLMLITSSQEIDFRILLWLLQATIEFTRRWAS